MELQQDRGHLGRLRRELDALKAAAIELERSHADEVDRIPEAYRDSARNLLHYAAVRQHDVRWLQRDLHALGLSSLGRMEAYVLASLNSVSSVLARLEGQDPPTVESPVDFAQGRALLRTHTGAVLGPTPERRSVRIMVTLGAEAAADPDLVRKLVSDGMNVMRINGSKNDPDTWRAQVANLRKAERQTGYRAKVLFDLSGPNPRTVVPSDLEGTKLAPGDVLEVVAEPSQDGAAPPAGRDAEQPPTVRIGCTLPEVLEDLRVGERFYLDDGACAGDVVWAETGRVQVKISRVQGGSCKLKPSKGMNFPDSDLRLPSLTDKDRRDLEAIVDDVDLVSLSFVRRPADVDALIEALDGLEASVGMVLKIETVPGFDNLLGVLLRGLRRPPTAIMVARGDMGVELGFDRLAEAQEEVLWMCEAAHVPTIWATQVLESLTKTGQPSRAEVTDAAMAGRAECVMLNRGKYVAESVQFLCNILERMEAHQAKKLALMRKLGISTHI